jgi:hypothetical protein
MLHSTIGLLRLVDGALPDFEDGTKALNFFIVELEILCMTHRDIGGSLQRILPKFLPRTVAVVDELSACKVKFHITAYNIQHIADIYVLPCYSSLGSGSHVWTF